MQDISVICEPCFCTCRVEDLQILFTHSCLNVWSLWSPPSSPFKSPSHIQVNFLRLVTSTTSWLLELFPVELDPHAQFLDLPLVPSSTTRSPSSSLRSFLTFTDNVLDSLQLFIPSNTNLKLENNITNHDNRKISKMGIFLDNLEANTIWYPIICIFKKYSWN